MELSMNSGDPDLEPLRIAQAKVPGGTLGPVHIAGRLIATCLALLVFFTADAGASGPIRVAVEQNSHAACAHAAKANGWYQAHGLTLRTWAYYSTGMALAAAFARGELDAAYMCLIPALNVYANAGIQIKIVAGTHQYGYSLMVDPERVRSVSDLQKEGVRIGCAREGSPTDVLLAILIDSRGLDSAAVLGNIRRMKPSRQLLSLRRHRIDAAFMPEQYPSIAEAAGFRRLVGAEELWPGMQGSVLVVTKALSENHPGIVEALVRVTDRSTRWINANPEAAAKITARVLNPESEGFQFQPEGDLPASEAPPQTPAILRSIQERLVCCTAIEEDQIERTIHLLHKLGYIRSRFPASEILDLRYLDPCSQ
jgi:NitT/TauT family transport system substrate-binding protein